MSDGPRANEQSGPADGGQDPSGQNPAGQDGTPSGQQPGTPEPGSTQQPWDRPRRWNAERMDATRVDDLLARLRSDDESKTPRRRRRAAPAAPIAPAAPAASAAPVTPATPVALPTAPQAAPVSSPVTAGPGQQTPLSQPITPPTTGRPTALAYDPEATVIAPVPATATRPSTPSSPAPAPSAPATRPGTSGTPSTSGTPWPVSSAVGAGRVSPISHDSDSTEILPVYNPADHQRNEADAVRESLRASLVSSAAAAQSTATQPNATPLGAPGPARVQKPPKTDSAPEREPHHYLKRGASVVLALVSALVLGVTGVYANIVDNADTGLKDNAVDAGLNAPAAVAPVQPTDAAGSSAAAVAPTVYAPENFLLVGSDTRAGANNIDGGADELGDEANTDSLMVLHLSGDRQQITVISLPRDLWAENVPCQTWDAATNTYGADADSNSLDRQHINSFYGVGGPRCLVDAVENLTNLTINRYIQIDFSGFSSMVDALGGVTINACGPIIDGQLATVLETGGVQLINGTQALNLARARKVEGDSGSDSARIHRQQLILSAILQGVKSAGTLLDPAKLNAFVQAFTNNTSTDGVDFQTLLNLAESLGDLDPAKVTFYTLPTVTAQPADSRGSMDIDQDRADVLLNAIRTDTPVPGTQPEPAATDTTPVGTTAVVADPVLTVAPDQINLTVVNAADVDGLAGEASAQLTEFGYSVPEESLERLDPDQTQDGITVEYATGNEAAALTVAASAPGATLTVNDDLGDEVRLLLGTSYDDNLVSAAVGDAIPAQLLAQIPDGSAANVLTPSVDPDADTEGGSEADPATADPSEVVAGIAQVNAATGDCL